MIIGVAGFLGSGKGTIGDMLITDYGYRVVSFADAVKDATSAVFGWSRTMLEGDTQESRDFRETFDEFWSEQFGYPVTPRYMLQLMGTEAGRDVFHRDIWVYAVMRKIQLHPGNYVIPDLRFKNEADFIKNMGGKCVRVRRGDDPVWFEFAEKDNLTDSDFMTTLYPEVHRSEYSLCGHKFDHIFDNNGSIEDLRNKLHIYMKETMNGY